MTFLPGRAGGSLSPIVPDTVEPLTPRQRRRALRRSPAAVPRGFRSWNLLLDWYCSYFPCLDVSGNSGI